MEIRALEQLGMTPEVALTPPRDEASAGFTELLQQAIEEVNQAQQTADSARRDFAVGEARSVHDTMITLEKADLSLRLLMQVRNKVVEAYQEVMRMPL